MRLIVKFRAVFIETTSNNINDIARLIVKFRAAFHYNVARKTTINPTKEKTESVDMQREPMVGDVTINQQMWGVKCGDLIVGVSLDWVGLSRVGLADRQNAVVWVQEGFKVVVRCDPEVLL